MSIRIIACLSVIIGLTAIPNGASAAIWNWGCQGEVGGKLVIFGRGTLYVVDGRPVTGDISETIGQRVAELAKAKTVGYEPQSGDAFESKTLEFVRQDDAKKKVILTEKSSRRLLHRSRLICGRDEILDRYRKVYRYRRESEPAHDITMQCFEYQLSTRGGRPCN